MVDDRVASCGDRAAAIAAVPAGGGENRRRNRIQGILRDDGQVDADAAAARQRDLDVTAFSDLTDKENLNFRYIY